MQASSLKHGKLYDFRESLSNTQSLSNQASQRLGELDQSPPQLGLHRAHETPARGSDAEALAHGRPSRLASVLTPA